MKDIKILRTARNDKRLRSFDFGGDADFAQNDNFLQSGRGARALLSLCSADSDRDSGQNVRSGMLENGVFSNMLKRICRGPNKLSDNLPVFYKINKNRPH